MFFDVTRAGTDRPLRIAVAAIAYLDTLPAGCVLHLVGGQGLHVAETATEVEERATAAAVAAAVPQLVWPNPHVTEDQIRESGEAIRAIVEQNAIDPVKEVEAAELLETAGVLPPGTAVLTRVEQVAAANGKSGRKSPPSQENGR